jgi:hypothetical protein
MQQGAGAKDHECEYESQLQHGGRGFVWAFCTASYHYLVITQAAPRSKNNLLDM